MRCGNMFSHMITCGDTWWHMIPYGHTWWHMIPYGNTWWHMASYGNMLQYFVSCGKILRLSLTKSLCSVTKNFIHCLCWLIWTVIWRYSACRYFLKLFSSVIHFKQNLFAIAHFTNFIILHTTRRYKYTSITVTH